MNKMLTSADQKERLSLVYVVESLQTLMERSRKGEI